MAITKAFKSGNSQALRIPADLEVEGRGKNGEGDREPI